MSIQWVKLALIAGLVSSTLGGSYLLGSSHGKAVIQLKWDKERETTAKLVEVEKAKTQQKEIAHRAEDRKISDELVNLKEANVAGNTANLIAMSKRLQSSDKRANLYRMQAEAGTAERADLAKHATELDKLLVESLGLLEEGRLLIELRDGQIRQLASQINNDRQLITE